MFQWERALLFVARKVTILYLMMDHWNFTGDFKKKRKESELVIQKLLLPEPGKVGVKFQFPDSRVRKL